MRAVDRLIAAGYGRRVRGTGRIAHRLYARRFGRSVPTRLNGLRWEADPLDWMDQQVLTTGSYEPEITAQLVAVLRPHDVYWDIGANAGVHALSLKAQRPDLTVIAFEPSPVQFSRLRHNAHLNDLEVTAYCIALADRRGYRNLSVVDVGNSGMNSLRPWDFMPYSGTFPCWCDTGNDLVRDGVPAPNVMKVDVESAEELVFAGFSEVLVSGALREIVFESPDGRSPALTDAGFRVGAIGCGADRRNWIARRIDD
jgi:FkbM family methyltransferase